MKRGWWIAIAAMLLAGGALALYRRYYVRTSDLNHLRELRAQHHILHARLESVLAEEPLLVRPELSGGDVVVAIRTDYLGGLIKEVSRRYLDRVDLNLGDIHVEEKGELKKKTFLGEMKLGDWTVNLDVASVVGTLGGHSPDLEVAPGNTVRIAMPVSVVSGRGNGVLHFAWSAKSLVTVVCHDFEVKEELEATVIPETYRLRGAFNITADRDQVVARPLFPRDKFRLRFDLKPESWARVKAALDAQDTWGKCGLAMDPEDVILKLRQFAQQGFDIRLPSSLFRPVTLPAGLHSQVEVEGTQVDVEIKAQLLALTPDVLWYGASVQGRIVKSTLPLPGVPRAFLLTAPTPPSAGATASASDAVRLPARDGLDVVLLDAGGVLVDPEWDRVAEVLGAHAIGVTAEALARAEPAAKRQMDVGAHIASSTDDSRHPSFFGLVLAGAGWDRPLPEPVLVALRAEHARHNLWRRVLPGVPDALGRLRASGLRLAVVSNANGTVQQLFEDVALAPYFDVLVDSFVEQIEKPDPRLFERALARLGVGATRAIHVGDLYHVDVVGARTAGITAALIDAGDLYRDADCPRFPSLPAFVDALLG